VAVDEPSTTRSVKNRARGEARELGGNPVGAIGRAAPLRHAALLDRAVAQIDAVEMQEVEGDELRLWRVMASERGMKGEEIRDAIVAEDHGLAVDDGRSAGKAGERLGGTRPR
jgi:hypothetical protein